MRVLALLLGALLFTASCEAPRGGVELRNASDDHLLWIVTTPEFLDRALQERTSWVTVPPGGSTIKRIVEGSPPDWCERPNFRHFLLRTRSGESLDGSDPARPVNVTIDDFEIVAQSDPGYCWKDSDPTWTFTGS